MKSKSGTIIFLYAFLVVVQHFSLVRGQDDEYEYYYEDEITSTVGPTTTTRSTTTTTMRTTTAGKRKPTKKGAGSSQTIVAGLGKNGKQIQQACRSTCVGYQYGRPDVVFNVIADMYDLQAMLPNNRRNGGYTYMGQNKEFASRFEQPFAYWYGPRQPAKPVRRQQPTLIDYGVVRRPGLGKETMYGYYDGGDLYSDYYDYYEYADYDYPMRNKQDAKTKDSNRLFVNFILNALGPRRSN